MEKFKIVYSGDVRSRLIEVLTSLEKNWGKRVAESFLQKYEITIKRLADNPKIGKIAQRDNSVRSILITKHNRLYFTVNKKTIMLLQLFDTRQNPINNKFE